MNCPWCQAPRGDGPRCLKCGADYAKAEAIKSHGRAPSVSKPAPNPKPQAVDLPLEMGPVATETLPPEIIRGKPRVDVAKVLAKIDLPKMAQQPGNVGWYDRFLPLLALPAALFGAYVIVTGEIAQALTRGFGRMVNHEFGHALVAWLVGHPAIPTIMKTHVLNRTMLWSIGFAAAMGGLAWFARRIGNKPLLYLGGTLLALSLVGSFASDRKAEELILFGGEGGGMLVATGFMAWFCAGPRLYLRGIKRWMLLGLGAIGFMEMWLFWWRSRRDRDVLSVAFGENEYVGRSDATRLTEDFGWTVDQLVGRHVTAGVVCLLALAALYAWSAWRALRPKT